jgi:pimeloyl-ACP methyl ester carboxylesterase
LLLPAREVQACLLRRAVSAQFRREHPEALERAAAVLRAEPFRRAELARRAAAGTLHDARAWLGRIRAPTLVLRGARDRLVSGGAAARLAAGIAGAELVEVQGAGHPVSLEHPEETAARVLDFLQRASRYPGTSHSAGTPAE